MFPDVLGRRNPKFVEAAMSLHRDGRLPANAYVVDLDAVEAKGRLLKTEASRLGLKMFAMTKQVGRASSFSHAVMRGGIDRAVAVDMACARATHRAGPHVGHLGHLQQVARHEAAAAAARFRPDYGWFSMTRRLLGQPRALPVRDRSRIFRRASAPRATSSTAAMKAALTPAISWRSPMRRSPGGRALCRHHHVSGPAVRPRNAKGSADAQSCDTDGSRGGSREGRADDIEVNAPGTTSSVLLNGLADAGATQCERGNVLHGTTALHVVEDLPERPAVCYLTEVSHLSGGKAYCFGCGFYIDPIFPAYDVKAIVSAEPTVAASCLRSVEVPPPSAIDYCAMIDATGPDAPKPGDTAVFGFRGQAFVTRAYVVGVSGIASGTPKVETIENGFGETESWPV